LDFRSRKEEMDAKNTCDGRRNDRSHIDYQGADDVQDAFSIVSVHDPNPMDSHNPPGKMLSPGCDSLKRQKRS
jgi:hypothetical protein